jgi:Fe-S cluster biogenesis protein NfuA
MPKLKKVESVKQQINSALDEIRPHLQMDGGDVDFVEFDEVTGVLKVKLQGACHGCPMAQITLQEGIGRVVKEKVPAVKEVLAV